MNIARKICYDQFYSNMIQTKIHSPAELSHPLLLNGTIISFKA